MFVEWESHIDPKWRAFGFSLQRFPTRMKRWHSTMHGKRIIFILVRGDLLMMASQWMHLVSSSSVLLSTVSTKAVAVSDRYTFSRPAMAEHLKTTVISTDIRTQFTQSRSAQLIEWVNIHITRNYVQRS